MGRKYGITTISSCDVINSFELTRTQKVAVVMAQHFISSNISSNFECYDNTNGDLVVPANYVIESPNGAKYQIIQKLGSGQFGNVYQATNIGDPINDSPQSVAIKITKSLYRYRQQAQSEVQILKRIMDNTTP